MKAEQTELSCVLGLGCCVVSTVSSGIMIYCECASGFIDDLGLSGEGYLDAQGRMFEWALKVIRALPEASRPELLARLDVGRCINHDFGYGVGDDRDDLLAQYLTDG